MTVTIHPTPNPNAHKYTAEGLAFDRPLNVSSSDEAAAHRLAVRIFSMANVYNVFWAQNFVTINKMPGTEWQEIDEAVVEILQDFLKRMME